MADVQVAKIPFGNLQASGTDELAGGSPVAMNVITIPGGALRRRPGFAVDFLVQTGATSITGLYETTGGDVYAVGEGPPRKIFKVNPDTLASLTLSNAPGEHLLGPLRPTFAETDALLVMAGGEEAQKVTKATPASSRLGGTPPQGSHIAAIAQRLLLNDVKVTLSQLHYSDVAVGAVYAGNEDWSTANAAGIFTAAARPDPILAVHENTNEVFVFGPTSLQIYAPDAQVFFAPVVNRELGCAAAYSVIKSDQNFAWLDHYRRFVLGNGREEAILSDPIQRDLHDMTRVDDCYGYRVVMGPLDMMVWTFPTDGRTFAYQKAIGWSEWGVWDQNWQPFPVTSVTRRLATNETLAGGNDGNIYKFDLDSYYDIGGDIINAYVITGFQDRGSDSWKECRRVLFSLRRGRTTGNAEPYLLVSYRDGLGPWEEPIPISLGPTGEGDPVVQLWSLGTYRRRQWKIDFKEAEGLTLVSASEEFRVLPG